MSNERWNEKGVEAAITRALEERRESEVPEGFAARVCMALPAKSVARRRIGVGQRTAMVMALVALSAMFVLASKSTTNLANLAFDLECLLMSQLAGIVCWLALRRGY
jgi:hypothetical protein